MKKLFLAFMMLLGALSFAQVTKGTSFIGVSTNSLTGLNFNTVKDSGVKNFQIGLQGGHFIVDRLAVVAGVGYNNIRVKDVGTVDEAISYQAGLKYYVENVLPVQLDYNGVDDVNYVGAQVGYAIFASKNFSLEPNLRYDLALKDSHNDKFSFGVGFNYFFK